MLAVLGAAALLLRCAAPSVCVRISDCDDGMTCIKGSCFATGPAPADEGDAAVASVSDAGAAPTTTGTDPGAGTASDAGDGNDGDAGDAGDDGAAGDASESDATDG